MPDAGGNTTSRNVLAVRTMHTKLLVRSVLEHPDRERIQTRLPPAISLAEITAAPNFGWTPLSTHDAICAAVEGELGEEAHSKVWRGVFAQSMQQPFLKGFLGFLQRFSSPSVPVLARRCHRIYEHLTRACGVMRWEEDSAGNTGRLHIEGFPAGFSAGRWGRSVLACMQAGAEAAGHSGEVVRIDHVDEEQGELAFIVDLD